MTYYPLRSRSDRTVWLALLLLALCLALWVALALDDPSAAEDWVSSGDDGPEYVHVWESEPTTGRWRQVPRPSPVRAAPASRPRGGQSTGKTSSPSRTGSGGRK